MEEIKQALDGGAQGILVPLVNTPEQAASVVRWGRYPPLGERGAGGLDPHVGRLRRSMRIDDGDRRGWIYGCASSLDNTPLSASR